VEEMSVLLRAQFGLVEDAPHLRQQETVLEEAVVIAKELCSHLTAWNKTLENTTEESRSLSQSLRSFAVAVGSPSFVVSSSATATLPTDQSALCNVVSAVAETHLGYLAAQQSLSLSIQKTTSKVMEVVNRELRTVQALTSNYERARSQFNALVICSSDPVEQDKDSFRRSHDRDDVSEIRTSTESNQNKIFEERAMESEREEKGGEGVGELQTPSANEGINEEREAKLRSAREECKQAEKDAEQRILAAINAIQLCTHDLVCCHSEEFSCFLSRLSFLVPSLHTTASHRQWIEHKRAELQNTSKPTILEAKQTATTTSAGTISSPSKTEKKVAIIQSAEMNGILLEDNPKLNVEPVTPPRAGSEIPYL